MRIAVIICLLLTFSTQAQSIKTDTIMTSAECRQCKDRIEGELNYMKGIKFAELNYETKRLVVRYKTKQTSINAIKARLNQIGYDADDTKADPDAVKALPLCCQPGGMSKEMD